VRPAPGALPDRRSARAKGTDGKGKDGKGKDGKGKDGKGKDKAAPKAPLPRSARRLRAVAASGLMLGLTGALGADVVQGVKGAKPAVSSAGPAAKPTVSPTVRTSRGSRSTSTAPSGGRSASASPKPTATFNPQTNTYTLPNTVLFETGSAKLRADAVATLQQVVQALTRDKRYGQVRITGYTDDTGSTAYNLRLSSERAAAVKQYLDGYLAPPSFMLTAAGEGESNFVARNNTEAGREKNRRVQIVVPPPPAQ